MGDTAFQHLLESGIVLATLHVPLKESDTLTTVADFGPGENAPVVPLPIALAATNPSVTSYPIRRLRRFRIAYEGHLNVFLRRIEFVLQPGTGLTTGQGSDPQLMFRLSKDGGLTWGREQWMGIGVIGEYTKRAYLNNLGAGRNLVGEISTSDPVQFSLIDCLADLEVGFS